MYGKTHFFYKTIRKTIIQFLDLFNGIEIERYEQNGTVRGHYMVPLKFVPKSKAYMWVTEKGRDEEMLPMMVVTHTGIDFDVNRMTNRHEKIRIASDNAALHATYANMAAPYNMSFSLQIFALHNVDIDQIYEQILPYFTPFAFFTVNIPEMGITFEVKVVLNSCSPMMTDDTTEEEARVIKWETQFQCQTFLFKPVTTVGLIGIVPFNPAASATPPPPSAWVNGKWTGEWAGTTGTYSIATSASSGGIIIRYYTSPSAWASKDDPFYEIENDPGASEIQLIQPISLIEVDGEAKILNDYELFGAK